MKKKLFSLLTVMVLIIVSLAGCKKDESDLNQVTLNEVAHSIFYAPQYVAIELGYFEDEGIDITLELGNGANNTMTALISNNADIGFMGSETTIYTYIEGNKDYAVNFAQLTQRAGNFLVAREDIDNFTWDMVKGKTIIGGREGGMPQMVLEYILKQQGIDPLNDVEIIQNIDFGLTSGAFAGGTGDFTVEFEPNATKLEAEGEGYVVASLGVDSGYVPYTSYCAKQSYIEDNPEIIQGFTNAIQKGMDYVNTHTSAEIAKVIAPQFTDTDEATLTTIVERYKAQDTWKADTIFQEESFTHLQDVLSTAGMLDESVPYSDLVTTEYSEKAIK